MKFYRLQVVLITSLEDTLVMICVFQEQADEPPHEKEKRIRNINNLHAFHLFCQHRFEESLPLFSMLGTGGEWKYFYIYKYLLIFLDQS